MGCKPQRCKPIPKCRGGRWQNSKHKKFKKGEKWGRSLFLPKQEGKARNLVKPKGPQSEEKKKNEATVFNQKKRLRGF